MSLAAEMLLGREMLESIGHGTLFREMGSLINERDPNSHLLQVRSGKCLQGGNEGRPGQFLPLLAHQGHPVSQPVGGRSQKALVPGLPGFRTAQGTLAGVIETGRLVLEILAGDGRKGPYRFGHPERPENRIAAGMVGPVVEVEQTRQATVRHVHTDQDDESGHILVLPCGGLQQQDGKLDIPLCGTSSDNDIIHAVDQFLTFPPEAVRTHRFRIPDKGRILPQSRAAVQEFAPAHLHIVPENIIRRGNPTVVLAHEGTELIQETHRLLAGRIEPDQEGMESAVHIPQRLSFAVPGDLYEMHRVQFRAVEFQILDDQVVEIHQMEAALRRGVDGIETVHPIHPAEDFRLDGTVLHEAFHHLAVFLLVVQEEIDAGPGIVEPGTEPGHADGRRQFFFASGNGTVSLQEDEPVRAQFLIQAHLLPATDEAGEDITDGDLRMDAVRFGQVHEDQISLVRRVFLPGPVVQDGLRQEFRTAAQAQEDMVLAVDRGGVLVHPQPQPVPQAARKDLEHQYERERKDEGEYRQVCQQQSRFPEDDGGDDIVEHHGVADEHLETGHQGSQRELDPVSFRHRMGGAGEQHHMDGCTQHEQEGENGPHPPSPALSHERIQEPDEKDCRDGEADKPRHHRGSRYGKIVHVHREIRFNPQI